MRKIVIIILLVLCLTLLLFTGCRINTVTPEPASGNLENQEDIDQSSNNSQSSSTDPVEEPATEEPVIEEDTEATGTVYPQKWATGDGTVGNPWANDCIQEALNFALDGGTVFLKSGYYELSGTIKITKKINIIGEGRNKTIIKTANASGFNIRHDNCTLKGFTIDGDAQEDGHAYYAPIQIVNCDYALLENIEAKNGGYYGIGSWQVNHSTLKNVYVHDSYADGIHPGSDTAGRNKWNTYRDIYVWNSGSAGFYDRGNGEAGLPIEDCYNVYDNIQAWDNFYQGIMIDYQKDGVATNLLSRNNGWGITLDYIKNFNVSNCSSIDNDKEGVILEGSTDVNLTDVMVKNNNIGDTDIAGMLIVNCSGIKLTSCQSYDDRSTPLQRYGIQLAGTNTGISFLNCKLSPNVFGEISNPNGAVIEVIIEKCWPNFSSFRESQTILKPFAEELFSFKDKNILCSTFPNSTSFRRVLFELLRSLENNILDFAD